MSTQDIITQLQDEIDKFVVQMYSSLHYLQTHHEMEPLDEKQPKLIEKSLISDETGLFKDQIHQLSQDLILRTKQINILIDRLPGIGRSEAEQFREIGETEVKLREAQDKLRSALDRKATLERELENKIQSISKARRTVAKQMPPESDATQAMETDTVQDAINNTNPSTLIKMPNSS